MNKFLFFRIKDGVFLNTLIISEIVLWILILGQLLSLLNFDTTYTEKFKKSYPINTGLYIQGFGNPSINTNDVYQELSHNYPNNFFISQKSLIDKSNINIKSNIPRDYLKDGLEIYENTYSYVSMNYNYINFLSKYINNPIVTEEWKVNTTTPVILGKNFINNYNIGDVISSNTGTNYTVLGFFTDSLIFSSAGYDPLADSESLDDAIVVPFNEINNNSNINVFIVGDTIDSSMNIFNSISKDNEYLHNKSIETRLEETNTMLYARKLTNFTQTLSISFLAIFILVLTINYKIEENLEKIGIFMTIGASYTFIIKKFLYEYFLLIIIAVFISIPLTYKLTEKSFLFFYSYNRIMTVFFSVITILIVTLITITLSIKRIRNLTLSQLIGGTRE